MACQISKNRRGHLGWLHRVIGGGTGHLWIRKLPLKGCLGACLRRNSSPAKFNSLFELGFEAVCFLGYSSSRTWRGLGSLVCPQASIDI